MALGEKLQHRGVVYSIRRLAGQRWRWAVEPPACVVGLKQEQGEVEGSQDEALRAARAAIERQTGQSAQ